MQMNSCLVTLRKGKKSNSELVCFDILLHLLVGGAWWKLQLADVRGVVWFAGEGRLGCGEVSRWWVRGE